MMLASPLFSQRVVDSLIQEMYAVWERAYIGYDVDHMTGELSAGKKLFILDDSTVYSQDLKAKIMKAESDLVAKDWGVSWGAGYIYNTSPGMEVADNILYKSRVQAQVSWNILNNGFLENKKKSQVLKNRSVLAELDQHKGNYVNQDILQNWHRVIYQFNRFKIEILDERLLLAEKRVAISYQLQNLGKITHEELLNNLESYAEISSLYSIYKDYNDNISQDIQLDSMGSLPLIDIDYNYSLDMLSTESSDSSKHLMMRNIELENRFIDRVSLNIYSRYNYYDLINNPLDNRAFLTLGVGVGMPISFQKKERAELMKLEKQQILMGDYEEDAGQISLKNDLLSYLYEFRYKLKQFNAFYYKKLKLEEMLRKEQARYDVNTLDFNPLKALRWLDESMSVDIELIDLKQQLYLYVLKMLSVAPQLDVDQLIKPLELADLEIKKVQKDPKEVYVWSKTLAIHDIGTLVNYCMINNISGVVVSSSSESAKFNEFAEKCQQFGITVDIMIGDNEFINNFSTEILEDKLSGKDLSLVDGVHLDVEPQTFDDWDDKKAFYAEAYVKMFETVHLWCQSNSLKLAASLPTYFPEEAVNKVFDQGGEVFFMCYENVTASYLEKRLGGYVGNDFTIALRPEDFADAIEMNKKIDELSGLLQTKRFIIHDLERLLKFDP
ncbi:TolC family protein [Parvicella tangerina]|uniref:Uncharacterized protein n=1 Tax=Parvicella tangerina TaxID=2829795 RepID=A0A916JNV6_9FLAO|nr:TolC family protein [Parvicella tangerina]CAG5084174.1 hypothetical protein CRYO30217_02397 [Parvicella tangerina]